MSQELCFSHQRAVQTIHGSIARCRLALIGPRVYVFRSQLDSPLPVHSIRVRAEDCQLQIDPADRIGCRDELDAHAHSWLLEHVHFRLARPRSTAHRRRGLDAGEEGRIPRAQMITRDRGSLLRGRR